MAFSSVTPMELPPFQLQPLIPTVFNSAHSSGSTSTVTCAQALGSEIYVGCSDGSLLRFALQANGPNIPETYTLLSQQTLGTNKAIDVIELLPSISRAMILSDRQLHFYIIPSLDPVPPQTIRPLRNVVAFAVDEGHISRPPYSPSNPQPHVEPVEFCVLKMTEVTMYSLGNRLVKQRDFPNSEGYLFAKRTGRFMCAANKELYSMVNLQGPSALPLLPIEQGGDDPSSPGKTKKPLAAVVSGDEFLMLSNLGPSVMGVFITGNGDPVRGTLEWGTYPESICIDYPYAASLLPNQTIEIHNIETQALVQMVSLTSSRSSRMSSSSPRNLEPHQLTFSHHGYLVPSTERAERLRIVSVPLLQTETTSHVDSATNSLTLPPGGPNPKNRSPMFPRSSVLIISNNSIHSLLPSTLISQAETLLESHRLDDTVDLADQHQRQLLGTSSIDDDQAEELRYVYQRLGLQCLSETLFEDAGRHLLAGETDPRILVSFYPDLRGDLLLETPSLPVFAGVAERLPVHRSIEEIVALNIARNYSPHLKPNTRSSPPSAELRRILVGTAKDMLASYLRKCRTRSLLERSTGRPQNTPVNAVVDTVLVKILAESEQTTELYTLIDEANDIVLSEVIEPLQKNGQYNALCKLYEKHGEEERLLEAWSKLVDGVWTDVDIKNPLTKMMDLLNKTTNRALVQQWGIWIMAKDPDLGLKLLISRDSKKSSKADDLALLAQIRQFNAGAGVKYLEYLVLQKRSQISDLHDQLAHSCVDQLLQCAEDEVTSKLWRAKASSYASSSSESSFLSYFSSTTPDSEPKRIRLKTALFLQGSELYDAETILRRLKQHDKILRLETAILYGKLAKHHEAIATLVHDMSDSTSAEAYCTLGGVVIPGKVANTIGERYGLLSWAVLVTAVRGPNGGRMDRSQSQRTVDEGKKRDLLQVLLEVYMSAGSSNLERTSRLMNAQAINLDVVDVISLVPPDWPLQSMSSFLARSFRRTVHEMHEGKILKSISAGQNLEVVEDSWRFLREQGAVVEEAVDDDEDKGGDEPQLSEKSGVHSEPSSVAEIRVDERKRPHPAQPGVGSVWTEST